MTNAQMQTTQISACNCNSLLKGAKQKQTNTHTHIQTKANKHTNKQTTKANAVYYLFFAPEIATCEKQTCIRNENAPLM